MDGRTDGRTGLVWVGLVLAAARRRISFLFFPFFPFFGGGFLSCHITHSRSYPYPLISLPHLPFSLSSFLGSRCWLLLGLCLLFSCLCQKTPASLAGLPA